MRVIYAGRASSRYSNPQPTGSDDALELFSNTWDDFGFETHFPVTCRINGQPVELASIKLLIEGVRNSSAHLDMLRREGWDGVFPIPQGRYVSVPAEIEFYEQLLGHLGRDKAVEVARALRDASYMTQVEEDPSLDELVRSKGFESSLMRERGAMKAYKDGWLAFSDEVAVVDDAEFRFKDVFGRTSTLSLRFGADELLPHDINVLIGPNGVGKSRILHSIVEDWIDTSVDGVDYGFIDKPNFSQIVVVSYSPFEDFPVDLDGVAVTSTDIYRYFGFRGREAPIEPSELGESYTLGDVTLSHDYPRQNAARSLVDCLVDDQRFGFIKNWPGKLKTVVDVLLTAIDFEFVAVEVDAEPHPLSFTLGAAGSLPPMAHQVEGDRTIRYLALTPDQTSTLDADYIARHMVSDTGVVFLKDGRPVHLSSGQKLFSYLVVNVLGAIRRNSLILIDEPELFLHPTLEIRFVEMLKMILTRLSSKALLATHSVVTVREMPSACVHVLEKVEGALVIKTPPFQTFAGDVQRISSYVFGDRGTAKPHEEWVRHNLDKYGSPEALLEALGRDVNEELILQIRAAATGKW